MPDHALIVCFESARQRFDAPLDLRALSDHIERLDMSVDLLPVPRLEPGELAHDWLRIFLGNLDLEAYSQVIGIDECGLLLRGSNTAAWLSRLPLGNEESDSKSIRGARLASARRGLLLSYAQSGGRIFAASGYLAGQLSKLSGLDFLVLPMVPKGQGEVQRVTGEEKSGWIPFVLLPDEAGPNQGWVEVVRAMSQLGTHAPSVALCSDAFSLSDLTNIRQVLRPLGEEKLAIFSRESAAASRRMLFDNCLAVVVTAPSQTYSRLVFEAARSAKPIVALERAGSTVELVSNGRTGYICRSEDELAASLNSIVLDRSLAAQMGEAFQAEISSSLEAGPLSMKRVVERIVR